MSIEQPVMFERFDKVVFKPVNSAQKYKAIINLSIRIYNK